MTDAVVSEARADSRPRPARRRKPGPFPVVAGTLAGFFGLFAFLGHQLSAGQDPALGDQTPAGRPVAKRVVIKRIERRVVVTRLLPPRSAHVLTAAPAPAAAAGTAPQPVTAQSAPAPAPVVRAPAAAPAPAPAPVVTRSS